MKDNNSEWLDDETINKEGNAKRGRTNQAEKSFVRDSSKLWNQGPREIKEAATIVGTSKRLI